MRGRTILEGRCAEPYTVFRAVLKARPLPSGSPVLGLTSNFGKLDEEMSSLMRCPALNRLAVANGSMMMRKISPRTIGFGSSQDARYRQRKRPSVRVVAKPCR